MSTRLSVTLTDSQNAALERIAAETGATKQSMIGLAVSEWIRENDVKPEQKPTTPLDELLEMATFDGHWSISPRMLIDQLRAEDRLPDPVKHAEGDRCEVCGGPVHWAQVDENDVEHVFCESHDLLDLRKDVDWYGWAEVTEPDPLSGEPTKSAIGYDGPFATRAEAERHAWNIADANQKDGARATPHIDCQSKDSHN